MTTALPGWRRLAVKLVRHAAAGLSGASPWARAMQCELDYIDDDRAALRWALGCVIASYKLRLAARAQVDLGRFRRVFNERNRRHPLSGARPREVLRQAAVSAALMLVTGVVLLENAGGQTAPRRPPLDETTCDLPGPRGAATAAAPCCATERNDRALDRVFPDRAQREAIQSVRGSIAADSNDHPAQAPETSCADRSQQEHDPEQARPGRDPGWPPVFGKDMLQQ